MAALIVREAQKGDYEQTCVLFRQLDDHHRDLAPETFQEVDGDARPSTYFRSYLEDPSKVFFVASRDGELLGFANCQLGFSPQHPMFVERVFVAVDNIFVLPEERRQGIGKALMEKIRAWGKRKGASEMRLSLYTQNDEGLHFYRQLGFADYKLTLQAPL
jgi:GNAT superfamily N-acetyltransferase